ncbi:hypothetical protein ACHAXT_005515 [Thalassiosira profunda]
MEQLTATERHVRDFKKFIQNNPPSFEWLRPYPEELDELAYHIKNKDFVNTKPEVFQMLLRLLLTSFFVQHAIPDHKLQCEGSTRWPKYDITGRIILAFNLLIREAEHIKASRADQNQANPLCFPDQLARRWIPEGLSSKDISLTYSELLLRIESQCGYPECIEPTIRHILDTSFNNLAHIFWDKWKFLPNCQWGMDCAAVCHVGRGRIKGIQIESPRDGTGRREASFTSPTPRVQLGTEATPQGSTETLGLFIAVDQRGPRDVNRQPRGASNTAADSTSRGEDPTDQQPNGTTNTAADSASRARDSIELTRARLNLASPAAQNGDPFGENASSSEESDTEDLFGDEASITSPHDSPATRNDDAEHLRLWRVAPIPFAEDLLSAEESDEEDLFSDEASLASTRAGAETGAVLAHASTTSQPQKSVDTTNTEPEPLDDTPKDAPKDDGSSSKRRHSATSDSDSPRPDETHSPTAPSITATHAMAQVTKRRRRTAHKSAGGKAPRPQLASRTNRGIGSWRTQHSIHFSVPVDRLVEEFQAGRDVVLDPSGYKGECPFDCCLAGAPMTARCPRSEHVDDDLDVSEHRVCICGWPTDALAIDHRRDKSDNSRHRAEHTLLLFVPGNPGVIHWYTDWLAQIVRRLGRGYAVRGVSYAGHGVDNEVVGTEDDHAQSFDVDDLAKQSARRKDMSIAWTMDGQIQHKIKWIDRVLADWEGERAPNLVFISHSIGAHFTQHLLLRRPDILAKTRHIIHLMPFFRFDPPRLKKRFLGYTASQYKRTVPTMAKLVRAMSATVPSSWIDLYLDKALGLNCKNGRKIAMDIFLHPDMVRNHLVLGFQEIRGE